MATPGGLYKRFEVMKTGKIRDWIVKGWLEQRTGVNIPSADSDDMWGTLLAALSGSGAISRTDALNIPTVAGCVEFIASTVASLTVKLYREDKENQTSEVKADPRLRILNDDTGDILSGAQWKKAVVTDYLLEGAGYLYKRMVGNNLKSLHYVAKRHLSVNVNADPIYKRADIFVGGQQYRDFDFIKVSRNTEDGVTGRGILAENPLLLSLTYAALKYERTLNQTGGNKRGFLSSENSLTQDQLTGLKNGFEKLYSNTDSGVIVLNKGISFEQASSTSVEMQLNENKQTNGIEICKLFNVPPNLLAGTATESEYSNAVKMAIVPVLTALEAALNKDLLLESEKASLYFAFDTKDLMKGTVSERFQAYTQAVQAGWLSKNEIRYLEDYKPIDGLDVVSMNLGDVIFDIKTGKYFTPNMNAQTDLTTGGEEIDDS